MLKNYNKYIVLKIFFDSPTEQHRLREISRKTNIFPKSVMNYLKELELDGLITKKIKEKIPFYSASRDNEKFILYKKISILFELNESGLIDELWEKLSPEAIILYGSYAKGESTEDSDLDLFIIGTEKEFNLKIFEEKLSKKIHLIFEKTPKKISNELLNNLINGIIIKGYFKVF